MPIARIATGVVGVVAALVLVAGLLETPPALADASTWLNDQWWVGLAFLLLAAVVISFLSPAVKGWLRAATGDELSSADRPAPAAFDLEVKHLKMDDTHVRGMEQHTRLRGGETAEITRSTLEGRLMDDVGLEANDVNE